MLEHQLNAAFRIINRRWPGWNGIRELKGNKIPIKRLLREQLRREEAWTHAFKVKQDQWKITNVITRIVPLVWWWEFGQVPQQAQYFLLQAVAPRRRCTMSSPLGVCTVILSYLSSSLITLIPPWTLDINFLSSKYQVIHGFHEICGFGLINWTCLSIQPLSYTNRSVFFTFSFLLWL